MLLRKILVDLEGELFAVHAIGIGECAGISTIQATRPGALPRKGGGIQSVSGVKGIRPRHETQELLDVTRRVRCAAGRIPDAGARGGAKNKSASRTERRRVRRADRDQGIRFLVISLGPKHAKAT